MRFRPPSQTVLIVGLIAIFLFMYSPNIFAYIGFTQATTESKYPIDFLVSAKDTRLDIIITSHTDKLENISNIVLSGDKLNYPLDDNLFTIKPGLSIHNYTLPFNMPDGTYTLLFNTTRLFTGYSAKSFLLPPAITLSKAPPETYNKYVVPVQYTQTFSIDTKPHDSGSSLWVLWIWIPIMMIIIITGSRSRRN